MENNIVVRLYLKEALPWFIKHIFPQDSRINLSSIEKAVIEFMNGNLYRHKLHFNTLNRLLRKFRAELSSDHVQHQGAAKRSVLSLTAGR